MPGCGGTSTRGTVGKPEAQKCLENLEQANRFEPLTCALPVRPAGDLAQSEECLESQNPPNQIFVDRKTSIARKPLLHAGQR